MLQCEALTNYKMLEDQAKETGKAPPVESLELIKKFCWMLEQQQAQNMNRWLRENAAAPLHKSLLPSVLALKTEAKNGGD